VSPSGPPAWRLVVSAAAERSLTRLPAKAAPAVVELMLGPLLDDPHRVGRRLRHELADRWVARRGPYRLVYRIDDERRLVSVVDIDHRADVYRPR
jgi:mRNA-degrading endonuclease RelE of RelBE toxin-antitoxin system